MARIFVYADSPTAPTGFGRSAKQVLFALHAAGHELVQLAVNHDQKTTGAIPWRVYVPTKPGDPYGIADIPRILRNEPPFDLLWTTFDPECPWNILVPGIDQKMTVLGMFNSLRATNPGFRMLGWFPVDAGPLSDFELAVLGSPQTFDLAATMSTHVHDLVEWTLKLKGQKPPDRAALTDRLKIVPHGVDLDAYRICDEQGRRAAKRALGFNPDDFLVVQVERNQPRKMPWMGYAMMEQLRHRLAKNARPVRLYQHMAEDEETQGCRLGYKLREVAWRYGLKPDEDVRWPARSFTDEEMVKWVYGAADVVFSGSAGEGFQYPLWEALACGRRVVAPNDSARKAWLSHTPGAFLYEVEAHSNVIRGSYNRRMSMPNPDAAASIIAKMVEGRSKFREAPEASRGWVGRTADVRFVQKWWVEAVEGEMKALLASRRANRSTVAERSDIVVDMRANVGLGDVLLAAPALRAFRKANPGKTVCLALPPTSIHQPLADWLDTADVIQTQPSVPIPALGEHVYVIRNLWDPAPGHPEWHGFRVNRTDLFAQALGLPPGTDIDASWPAPPKFAEKAGVQVRHRFGVELKDCVILACDSAQKNRTLPVNYLVAVAEKVCAAGLTPMILGRIPLPIERVGFINLTGKTDLMGILGLIAGARAVVAIDSLPLHIAATMGRPTVALMPLYPAHVRLAHYKGPLVVLEPPPGYTVEGETFPAGEHGKDGWVESFRPGVIARALGDVLGDRDMFEPKMAVEV